MTRRYHPGEVAVQERAGVFEMARRVGGMIHASIPPAAQEFLESLPMVILGSVAADGRVWASAVAGRPGFLRALDDRTVRVEALPSASDPLHPNLKAGGEVGMLLIDLATRRRMRINGTLEAVDQHGWRVHASQVYGNCPKYIQARRVLENSGDAAQVSGSSRGEVLTAGQREWIGRADTFFIASHDFEGGADASHRGGNPGFVRDVSESRLVWPDYSGNMMFQTLGNLVRNPSAGLLFVDFTDGSMLQVAGAARIVWEEDRISKLPGAERLVEYDIADVIETRAALPLRWGPAELSPFNPA